MKRLWLAFLTLALLLGAAQGEEQMQTTELWQVTAEDGYTLTGKLDLPAGEVRRLVVFINGSGPNTYDNTRQLDETTTYNYFDLFAERLTAGGTAFFRWSTRGCTPGGEPPLYTDIDEAAYQTYVPENSIRDAETVVRALREDERLANCPLTLLGWSEGTMIAPQVAARGNVQVDELVLCGYVNGTMMETLAWQQTGGSSMVFYREYFDADGDGSVSQTEFGADPYGILPALGSPAFEDVDMDGDGALTAADFAAMLAPGYEALLAAIARGDDTWLAENYAVRLTCAWFAGHEVLAPNREVLPTLDLPIHILHGVSDANAPVEGVYEIEAAFAALGKTNLDARTYPGHDHDLNYLQYQYTGELSQGFAELLTLLTA